MKRFTVDFKDELWNRLEKGDTVTVDIVYVKERKEIFILEHVKGW